MAGPATLLLLLASSPTGDDATVPGAAAPFRRASRLIWIGAVLLLCGLAWQGHRVAHLLPQIEQTVVALGPWGPVAYVAGVALLSPLLVPDTIFAVAAGVCFGIADGFVYYFVAVYLACLIASTLGRHWLRGRVLASLAGRPALAGMARAARSHGLRLTFWVRLVPLNPALVSYALGAVGVSRRAVAIGSFGMFPHMFLAVYLGAAAAHVTRMAAASHTRWTAEGAALLLGLVACAGVVAQISSLAMRQIRAAETEEGPEASA